MTAAELIRLLSAFPPDTEVKRLTWVCMGHEGYDYREAQDIDEVLPPGNEHDKTAAVIN